MSESESLWSNMNAFNWSKSAQLLFDSMSETRSKRECGKEKSLGAPGPLPGSCLATYRDVFLATEYLPGGEEASAEGVKEEAIATVLNTCDQGILVLSTCDWGIF